MVGCVTFRESAPCPMVRISPSLVLVDMVIDGRCAGNDGRVTHYFQASGDERRILAECFMVRSPVDEPIPIPNTIGARKGTEAPEHGRKGVITAVGWDIYARQALISSQAALAALTSLTAAFCKAVRFCSRAR